MLIVPTVNLVMMLTNTLNALIAEQLSPYNGTGNYPRGVEQGEKTDTPPFSYPQCLKALGEFSGGVPLFNQSMVLTLYISTSIEV